MAHKSDTLAVLDGLIAKTESRLEHNPDYVELRALKRARDVIVAETAPTFVDDVTRQSLRLVPTGEILPEPMSQLEAVRRALELAKVPLDIGTLVERARALGATVGGKDPNVNLGSTLSRSTEFKSVRWQNERKWWFADRQLPGPFAKEAAE